jgi:hypothetical protein
VLALEGAAKEPVKTAKSAAKALAEYGKEAVSSPAGMTKFLAENVTPLPRVPSTGPVSQVVRPRNQGMVLDIPDEKSPMGYVPQYLKTAATNVETANATPDQKTALLDFFNSKARNYFTRQFGTPDDPILKAIVSGKLTNTDLQRSGRIPSYMTKAAKEGKARVNPETGESRFYPSTEASQALRDINKVYDQMTGMRGAVFTRDTVGSPRYETLPSNQAAERQAALRDLTTQQLIDQGVPAEQINEAISLVGYKSPEFVAADKTKSPLLTADYMPLSKSLQELFLQDPNKMPKAFRTAIEKGEPIYDIFPTLELERMLAPRELTRYLLTLPPEKIKNIRFEDAIKGAVKQQEEVAQRKQFVDRIKANKPVPNEVFLKGVSAPLVTYGKESQYPGFTWRRITDPEATTIEGAYVGHSVGGFAKDGGYGPKKHQQFVDGEIKVYSLRDERGRPVTTVEVYDDPKTGMTATQIRGSGRATGNVPAEPYGPALVDLFKDIGVTKINESDRYLPPALLAYKNETTKETAAKLTRRALEQPEQNPDILQLRGGAPRQIDQGIGGLPQAPRNVPDPGFIEAMRRRLFGDED